MLVGLRQAKNQMGADPKVSRSLAAYRLFQSMCSWRNRPMHPWMRSNMDERLAHACNTSAFLLTCACETHVFCLIEGHTRGQDPRKLAQSTVPTTKPSPLYARARPNLRAPASRKPRGRDHRRCQDPGARGLRLGARGGSWEPMPSGIWGGGVATRNTVPYIYI